MLCVFLAGLNSPCNLLLLQELYPLMAHTDRQSDHDKPQVDKKEKDPEQATGPTNLQKARARFLKGVSYFSGDMEVFGKWMQSKSTNS